MKRLPWFVFSILACLTAMPVLAQAPNADDGGGVVLRAGDAVRLTIWRRPELSGEWTIAPDGRLAHPLYRVIPIAGVPFGQVEQNLEQFLTRFEATPQFVAEPLLSVEVAGMVQKPNVYSLPPQTTIMQAVALAGGQTPDGRDDRVQLIRDGRLTVIDLRQPETGQAQMLVHSHDQIIVERAGSLFHDFIAPAITLAGATAAILNIVLRRYPH